MLAEESAHTNQKVFGLTRFYSSQWPSAIESTSLYFFILCVAWLPNRTSVFKREKLYPIFQTIRSIRWNKMLNFKKNSPSCIAQYLCVWFANNNKQKCCAFVLDTSKTAIQANRNSVHSSLLIIRQETNKSQCWRHMKFHFNYQVSKRLKYEITQISY